ncbi:MAG: hypothetical protein ABI333_17295 [bacterium]
MKSSAKECRMARRELSAGAGAAKGRPAVDRAVQSHVDGCAECRAFAEDCVRLAALGRAVGAENRADEALVMRLANSGRARARERRSRWDSVPRWTLPALSASLSAAAVILVLGLQGSAAPSRPRTVSEPADAPRAGVPPEGPPVRALDRLATLLVIRSTTAVETTIPVDLVALRERALVQRLRGDGADGSSPGSDRPGTRRPRSREVIHEQR